MRRSFVAVAGLLSTMVVTALPSAPPQAAPAYTIEAIRYANLPKFPLNALVMGAPESQKIDIAMVLWLIRGGGQVILLDTGYHLQKYTDSFHVTDFMSPDKAVQSAGVDPSTVTDVIISHAHWDHMGGIDLFPKATIWIQKGEYEYYTGSAWQEGGHHGNIEPEDVKELVRRNLAGRVHLVDGDDKEILPGIHVYTGARHTYASQYVRVEGSPTYVLASDNCYLYQNLSSHRPGATFEASDSTANLAAQRRMVELAGSADRVVPGHDPAQFERFRTNGRVAKIR